MKKIFYSIIAVAIFTSCIEVTPTPTREDFELEVLLSLDSTKVNAHMIADVVTDIEYLFDSEERLKELSDRFDNLTYDELNIRTWEQATDRANVKKELEKMRKHYYMIEDRYKILKDFFSPAACDMMLKRVKIVSDFNWNVWLKYHTGFNFCIEY